LSWDANLMANLRGSLDVGLNYRHQESWGIRLGVQATKRTYIGYVYEMPTTAISKVSNQTHELALRFFILKDKKKSKESERIRIENLRNQRISVEGHDPLPKNLP